MWISYKYTYILSYWASVPSPPSQPFSSSQRTVGHSAFPLGFLCEAVPAADFTIISYSNVIFMIEFAS